jgi:hypothetical protein
MPGEHDGGHQHAEANRNPFENHIGTFGNSRRRREWGLKPLAANALDKVRDSVRKKQTADKLQYVNVPRHFGSPEAMSRPGSVAFVLRGQ